MILVVAGTRTIDDFSYVEEIVTESPFWKPSKIISGDASGPDEFAEVIAIENGIPYEQYEAEWDELDDAAGPVRNREMARDAHALVAIWNGHSSGTRTMIDSAMDENLHVYVINTQVHRPHEWW